ncbi:MAG: hypothetical protein ACO3F2_13215 [Roseiflexaceae bacterium]
MIAFRTFWQACINIFEDLFIVLLANVMWVIIALPLPYLAVTFLINTTTVPGGILMLLLIPFALAFASGGLTYLARQIIDGKAVRIPDIWYGMRFQYKRQLQLYALWCVVLYTLAFNMWFYSQTTGNLQILTFLFFYLTIFWMMYLAFLMPLSRRFPDHSIRLLMRNAAGLMFTVAGSMIIMMVLTAVLLAISLVSVIVMVFFFAIFTTLWGTHMVDAAIKIIEDRESESDDDGDTHDAARRPAGQIRPRD